MLSTVWIFVSAPCVAYAFAYAAWWPLSFVIPQPFLIGCAVYNLIRENPVARTARLPNPDYDVLKLY